LVSVLSEALCELIIKTFRRSDVAVRHRRFAFDSGAHHR
jgi:hypothetical protein